MVFLYRGKNEVIWLGEDKLVSLLAVDKYSCYARSSKVACSVILPAQSRSEDAVHIHVGDCIRFCTPDISKHLVYRPHIHALGNFLVRAKRVLRVSCSSAP